MSDTNRKRVISGAVLTAIIAGLAFLGGPALLVFTALLSVVASKEFFAAVSMNDSLLMKINTGCIVFYYLLIAYFESTAVPLAVFTVLIVFGITAVVKFPVYTIQECALSFFAFVYTGFLMSFLYLNRCMDRGVLLFILVFLCSWLGDTFGYAIGRRFGKHKMTPVLSPKKSVEGLAAELIGVTLTALVFGVIFKGRLNEYRHPVFLCFCCGLFGSILSVFGDLLASAVKREYAIKDYGTVIPGHGGILDRFDSVLFTAPLVYFIFYLAHI